MDLMIFVFEKNHGVLADDTQPNCSSGKNLHMSRLLPIVVADRSEDHLQILRIRRWAPKHDISTPPEDKTNVLLGP